MTAFMLDSIAPDGVFDRKAMILAFLPLVQSIAYRLVTRFPRNIDVEDLINVGTLGLIDAIDRFNPTRQQSFKAYAELRIRGAMIDELRQLDWVPRSVRQRTHELEKAQRSLETELGRRPTDSELAQHLGMNLDDYQSLARYSNVQSIISLEDLGVGEDSRRDILQVLRGESEDPAMQLEARYATERLAEAISTLPAQQREVITYYYYHDMTLKEIGNVMNVTESRVSQIHSQALTRLRKRLRILATAT